MSFSVCYCSLRFNLDEWMSTLESCSQSSNVKNTYGLPELHVECLFLLFTGSKNEDQTRTITVTNTQGNMLVILLLWTQFLPHEKVSYVSYIHNAANKVIQLIKEINRLLLIRQLIYLIFHRERTFFLTLNICFLQAIKHFYSTVIPYK